MSRLTGSDVKSMMEAYNAVYAPQELTEEQVWVEVENWVNSLLEEGYDLSEYTWEEMYESYLSEFSIRDVTAGARQNLNKAASTVSDIAGSGLRGYAGKTTTSTNPISRSLNAATRGVRDAAAGFVTGRGSAPEKKPEQKSALDGKVSYQDPKKLSADAAADLKRRYPQNFKNGDGNRGGEQGSDAGSRGANRGGGGSRPPAASKPAAKPSGPAIGKLGSTTFERRTPTSAELKAAQAARASGASPEKALQAAKAAGGALSQATAAASKPAAFNPTSTPTPAAAPKPPTRQLSAADKRQGIKASYEYDAYDLVLEYLLAEGHADTVEEANYVMLEMDAEMVQDIVEAAKDQSDKQIEKGVKTTYKAGNVLDNTHQGRSPGLNKLPAGERKGKTERMRGRLKTRRDDLFGERNKREDEKMSELKKKLGL
jgi:hypothetical protein